MFYGYYTPILILQGLCLFHSYKNNTHQKYYWLIIFVPFVGSLIYLYLNFDWRLGLDSLTVGVQKLINANHDLDRLEKETRFTDTVTNKRNLADEYMRKSRYKEAIALYESCISGPNHFDTEIDQRLVRAYYMDRRYDDCIRSGNKMQNVVTFKNNEDKALLAWAYYYTDQKDKSISLFKEMNSQFSNYPQRLEYAKMLVMEGKVEEAKALLQKMMLEIEHMDSYEKRLKRGITKEIEAEFKKLK